MGRLPVYLQYIRSQSDDRISAAEMARALRLGEVMVRKDLSCVSDQGRPKIGYPRQELLGTLEELLGSQECTPVVIAGAGKLGRALMRFKGFEEYGLRITAAFDVDVKGKNSEKSTYSIHPIGELKSFCRSNDVRVGVITVPAKAAQEVCDKMVDAGITAIWNFAPCRLTVPDTITVKDENLALSLAHLCSSAGKDKEKD